MTRIILLFIGLLVLAGCPFDEQLQYNQRFPAKLEVKNETSQEFSLQAISNSQDATEAFVITENVKILSGKSFITRVTEGMYEDLRQGRFVVRGNCASQGERKIPGSSLTRKAVRNNKEWIVRVFLDHCEG